MQKYEYRVVHRSQLRAAPYNPRTMSPYARKKLFKKVQQQGIVEPIVWNEQTGHVVSGHQRLSILDQLEGTPDYHVGVAAVLLSESEEREQNVFFNNLYAQGGFDHDRFVQLLKDPTKPTLEGMGFTKADLELEFGPDPTLDPGFAPLADAQAPLIDELAKVAASKDKWNEIAKQVKEVNEEIGMNDSDYSLALIFESRDEWEAFITQVALSEGLLLADDLEQMLREEHRWRT